MQETNSEVKYIWVLRIEQQEQTVIWGKKRIPGFDDDLKEIHVTKKVVT